MLKGKHEELIRGGINEEHKPTILSHMARILLVFHLLNAIKMYCEKMHIGLISKTYAELLFEPIL